MRILILFHCLAVALPLAPLTSHAFDPINDTLYLETTGSIYLHTPDNANEAMRTFEVPEEAILAINVNNINQALQDSSSQYACRLRVVDINDNELRSSEALERDDLCLSLSDLRKMKAMDSNGDEIKRSFNDYIEHGDLTSMSSLAKYVTSRRLSQLQFKSVGADEEKTQELISPLKNCSQGCLQATSEFSIRVHPVTGERRQHKGIDLRAKIGTQVVSVLDGKVLALRTERNKNTKKISGYGHYVIVVHPANKIETLYAHLSQFKTKSGAQVKQGELIALSGNSGLSSGPHLHFETHKQVKSGYEAVNPRSYLSNIFAAFQAIVNFFGFA